MISATAAQIVLFALANRLQNESVFTAFDVTLDSRDETDENISAFDVRRIVSSEFAKGQFPDNYTQDIVVLDLPNTPNVICYVPYGKSPLDHPKALKTPTASTPIVPVSDPVSVINQPKSTTNRVCGGSKKQGDSYICETTVEGRLNIPKAIWEEVVPSGGTLDININGTVTYQRPDAKNMVRIPKSKLGGKKYKVYVNLNCDTIVVENI